MEKVVSMKDFTGSNRGRVRRLEAIKQELLRSFDIDLDELLSREPPSRLSEEEFDELIDRILATIDTFCEEHSQTSINDLLWALEDVKDIIKENASEY
ncbi:MAG: hypothetical protein K6360_00265 [Deltaproteobacteria bacterium]